MRRSISCDVTKANQDPTFWSYSRRDNLCLDPKKSQTDVKKNPTFKNLIYLMILPKDNRGQRLVTVTPPTKDINLQS